MKLEYLRAFVAVVEAGELAAAGERLGRTAAALSMTLKLLESDLGGPLFEGERKGRLTPLGKQVLMQARRAVGEFDAALSHIRQYASGGAGLVQVAAVPSAATRLLPGALSELRQHHPLLRVDLRDIDSAAVLDAVASAQVDFGIATLAGNVRGIVGESLLQDSFVLVCPARHRLTRLRRPVRWSDLDPGEFIANGLCARIAAPEVTRLLDHCLLTARNTTALLAFVEQGFGVTLLPALAVPTTPSLRCLPLLDQQAVRDLELLTRADETPSPAARALQQALRHSAARQAVQLPRPQALTNKVTSGSSPT